MSDPLRITADVVVPAAALRMHAARASGPGGQNVNKVASKVELRVELAAIRGLTSAQRERLARLAAPRLDAEGRLLVTSQLTRDQARNLEDARAKVRELVTRALRAPRRRVATRPSAGAVERRVAGKKRRGERKRERNWRPERT